MPSEVASVADVQRMTAVDIEKRGGVPLHHMVPCSNVVKKARAKSHICESEIFWFWFVFGVFLSSLEEDPTVYVRRISTRIDSAWMSKPHPTPRALVNQDPFP